MKVDRIARRGKKRQIWSYLPQGALAAAALVALWQRQRAHRSVSEICPPEQAVSLPSSPPHVTIILPVRNEAAHIDACLASLCAQDYPDFSILVIDDGSTDATPELLAGWLKRDSHVQIQHIDHLPGGWAGKAHALHTGVLLTQSEWLLFTDADTRHEPQTLRLMINHALHNQDDLLSTSMNFMTLQGPVTPLLMPITEILLAQRVTPSEVKKQSSPRAFAFGQYILLRRSVYLATGGYAAPGMRASAVEDLALAEHIKHGGGQLEIVDGRGLLHNLQWTTWKSARQGWSKGCYSEIIRSDIPLAGFPAALAIITYSLGPFGTVLYALLTRKARRSSLLFASLALLAQIDAKYCFDRQYGLPGRWALTAPFAWLVCGIMALDVTRIIMTGQRTAWKGRQIPFQERAAWTPLTTYRQRIISALTTFSFSAGSLHEGNGSTGGSNDSTGDTA